MTDGFYEKYKLPPIVNACGTMTHLGACSALAPVVNAVAESLPMFVQMPYLQARASEVIARLCDAEAGCITACAAAGISVGIAACMTGEDMSKVEQLPDTTGMKNEVVVMRGHCVAFGAPILQMIRIPGAKPVEVGGATRCNPYHLEGGITERTVAALYVVSHHTVQGGQLPLKTFAEICNSKDVPVIVDVASEYDLKGFLADGADLVTYSGHKFLSGPTSGILAGRLDLIRACYLQERGIGRPMKVGKEGIIGAIVALEEWEKRDHAGIRKQEEARCAYALDRLSKIEGLTVSYEPDPTHNPITRVKVEVDELRLGINAAQLAAGCLQGIPRVIVRSHHVDLGYFLIDPCNMTDEDMVITCNRIEEVYNGIGVDTPPGSDPLGYSDILAKWPHI